MFAWVGAGGPLRQHAGRTPRVPLRFGESPVYLSKSCNMRLENFGMTETVVAVPPD
jgi:hypothetical protein